MTLNKHYIKTTVLFSLFVFIILIVTMFTSVLFTILLTSAGVFNERPQEITLITFAIASIIIGTALSRIAGKRPIGTIIAISEATKEVAKGNFDIQLDENIRAVEIRNMAHNFNLMAKELANTEVFRNDFIGNVSHEFKTPLSAIEGYATLLQKKNLSEAKKAEYIEKITFNTKRLSALTGNILLLSRLENQELEIKKETYSLDEQLREIILLFETQWNEKNLNLDIDLDTVDYFGNYDFLAQVWQNILGNAIKFVPDQGQIRIILRNETNFIKVTIADNGIGMNSEVQQRIFEKFYQGDASHSTTGNGLGLTLAKRIIDLHKGSIQVSSQEGRGSSFTIILPTKLH